ncbi:hypothetical protein JCM6882_005921 [Rhodosporidiobolus microsporus]
MALSLHAFQVRRALALALPLPLLRRSLLTPPPFRPLSTSSARLSRPQTPFTALLQRQFAALESDLNRSMTALYHPSELFEADPAAKELLSWSSLPLSSSASGGEGARDGKSEVRSRSLEIIKHRSSSANGDGEGEGTWHVEVYAQDGGAPEGSVLKTGGLVARGEGKGEGEALAQAAKKALEVIKGQAAVEGGQEERKQVEAGEGEGGEKQQV